MIPLELSLNNEKYYLFESFSGPNQMYTSLNNDCASNLIPKIQFLFELTDNSLPAVAFITVATFSCSIHHQQVHKSYRRCWWSSTFTDITNQWICRGRGTDKNTSTSLLIKSRTISTDPKSIFLAYTSGLINKALPSCNCI